MPGPAAPGIRTSPEPGSVAALRIVSGRVHVQACAQGSPRTDRTMDLGGEAGHFGGAASAQIHPPPGSVPYLEGPESHD